MGSNVRHSVGPIRVGTSGYSYAEWTEAGFYPPSARAGEMLAFYARHFGITELNYTWYQMPKAASVERLLHLAPDGFRFTAKLTRTLTHTVRGSPRWCSPAGSPPFWRSFRRGSPATPPAAATSPSSWTNSRG